MDDCSILIVDEDTEYRNTLTSDLNRRGFRVSGTSSGKKAFELFPEMKFDLVIAGVEMADGNGLAILKQLHADKIFIPVILSSTNLEIKEANAVKQGASGLIHRPFRPLLLAEKIAKVLPPKTGRASALSASTNTPTSDFAYFLNIRRALVIVSWTGELRPKDSDKVRGCLAEVAMTRAKFVIVNFHGFTGYDSVLAGDIVYFQEKIRSKPAWLLLAGIDPVVREKLSANGLVKDGEILPTLKEALQYALSTGLS